MAIAGGIEKGTESFSRPPIKNGKTRSHITMAAALLAVFFIAYRTMCIPGGILTGLVGAPNAPTSRHGTSPTSGKSSLQFDWRSLKPSRDLDYVSCYDGFECSRLLLPMDWTASEERQWDHEVTIAMIRLRANISILDPRYGGEVYMNPGGPGASGVAALIDRASLLQHSINGGSLADNEGKLFDIVSFDPRGVANSSPRISCFDDPLARQLWHQLESRFGDADRSDRAMGEIWARSQALGKICAPGDSESLQSLILSTISTAFVARDMLEMVERSGEARDKKVLVAARETGLEESKLPESLRYRPGKELLRFWGFSYGTQVGGTFAGLYPDRVGTMILDGGGDLEDYVTGEWQGFLVDTERGWHRFFELCHQAGIQKCALYDENGPAAIKKSVDKLLDDISHTPVAVWSDDMVIPDILTRTDLIQAIFSSLYRPYTEWEPLAQILATLINGSSTSALGDLLPSRKLRLSCVDEGCNYPGCEMDLWHETNAAITCSDMPDIRNSTRQEIETWMDTLRAQSPMFTGIFAPGAKIPCVTWPVRPKWHFSGPFAGKTKTPILFIGNTADPVAPLQGTRDMAKAFEGAGLIVQDSLGHCSFRAPNSCTIKHVRRYFASGVVPPEGTVCLPDRQPFEQADFSKLSGDERELAIALSELTDTGHHLW